MSKGDAADVLREFQPKHEFFIGIDSDGCAFDSMEIKHKECFIPNTIKHWKLQAVSKYAREAAEFVNLYSKWRGANRWPALVMVFDLLAERKEVQERGVKVPKAEALREWMERETKLSNDALKKEMSQSGDPVLTQAYGWSIAVNETIADIVEGVPPFPLLRETLEKGMEQADMMVVSQTPCEALVREWQEHGIDKYVEVIAGQEMGTKTEHLAMAAKGKYGKDKILMIGDAPGDMKAAQANDALFYPVNPGNEEACWERLHDEALDKFLAGTYAGDYEAKLVAEFDKYLPSVPPWKA